MIDKKRIKSILVIKLRNIGDVLLTSPVFANLREHFPSARICALVNSGTEDMLTGNPCIDHVYVYERKIKDRPFISRMYHELALMGQLRKEHFDMLLNLTEGDRGAIISLLSGAGVRVGVDARGRGLSRKNSIFTHLLPVPDQRLHTVEQNLKFLEVLGFELFSKRVSFNFSSRDCDAVLAKLAEESLEPNCFFMAHMTSRWMFKTLPPQKGAMLLDRFCEHTGLPAILTASPEKKEMDYLDKLLSFCRYPHRNWGGALTLKELGALSSVACFFVGVDSAPMHIAAALGTPVLAFFGPSSAVNWGPWDNDLQDNPYREPRGIQTTGRHMVLQSAAPCVPCHRDGCNGSKKSDCLDFGFEIMDDAIKFFPNTHVKTNHR